jgi:hypothetical protein
VRAKYEIEPDCSLKLLKPHAVVGQLPGRFRDALNVCPVAFSERDCRRRDSVYSLVPTLPIEIPGDRQEGIVSLDVVLEVE